MNKSSEAHIVKRYDDELGHLCGLTLAMGKLVIEQLKNAINSFDSVDLALAQRVVSCDGAVDQMEVRIDEEINHVLALRCPVSEDLRMVIAISKSVSDLEHIGDEAVRIAGMVIQLFENEAAGFNSSMRYSTQNIADLALGSLQGAVELFEDWNEAKAIKVIESYHEMEEEFHSNLRQLITYIMENHANMAYAISIVEIIKALERIGHLSQNIAEYILFQINGLDVRRR